MSTPFSKGGKLNSIFEPSLAYIEIMQQTKEDKRDILLSSIGDDDEQLLSSMLVTADKNLRSFAASLAIEWTLSGEHDYESLESLIVGAVTDSDDDITEDENDEIDELLNAVSQFILDVTDLSETQVQTLFEDENDDLAVTVANAIEQAIKGQSTDELIANYAEKQALLLSAVQKVVRDGKAVLIKKRTKKRRMSPAQKAALKKAQKKSHSAAANAHRKKSNRLRTRSGM